MSVAPICLFFVYLKSCYLLIFLGVRGRNTGVRGGGGDTSSSSSSSYSSRVGISSKSLFGTSKVVFTFLVVLSVVLGAKVVVFNVVVMSVGGLTVDLTLTFMVVSLMGGRLVVDFMAGCVDLWVEVRGVVVTLAGVDVERDVKGVGFEVFCVVCLVEVDNDVLRVVVLRVVVGAIFTVVDVVVTVVVGFELVTLGVEGVVACVLVLFEAIELAVFETVDVVVATVVTIVGNVESESSDGSLTSVCVVLSNSSNIIEPIKSNRNNLI